MTVGFPLSPLAAATLVLISVSKVNLIDHQKFTFLWAFGTTVVMTIVAYLTGALTF
jgi:CitMHS family citrate-Mg2+:H+ or citrate-Ca2+:H+ symporter